MKKKILGLMLALFAFVSPTTIVAQNEDDSLTTDVSETRTDTIGKLAQEKASAPNQSTLIAIARENNITSVSYPNVTYVTVKEAQRAEIGVFPDQNTVTFHFRIIPKNVTKVVTENKAVTKTYEQDFDINGLGDVGIIEPIGKSDTIFNYVADLRDGRTVKIPCVLVGKKYKDRSYFRFKTETNDEGNPEVKLFFIEKPSGENPSPIVHERLAEVRYDGKKAAKLQTIEFTQKN